jgi:hypothetical protein
MVIAGAADFGNVIYRVIKTAAFLCCALVVLSFAMFARDQLAGASAHQQSQLVPGSTQSTGAATTTHRHAQPRRFIDGAAKALTAPFAAIVQSSNAWVKNGLPTAFALLVYGLGLGYLARYSSGLAHRALG